MTPPVKPSAPKKKSTSLKLDKNLCHPNVYFNSIRNFHWLRKYTLFFNVKQWLKYDKTVIKKSTARVVIIIYA